LVGIGFAVISRTTDADKTFGYLLFIQWGLGLIYLNAMVPELVTAALFIVLMSFAFAALLMLPFLLNYPVAEVDPLATFPFDIRRVPLQLILTAIVLFQATNMRLFAYVIGLGQVQGLTLDYII
jgi:hypothetical protein